MRIPVLVETHEPDPEDFSERDDARWFWEKWRDDLLPLPDLSTLEPWEQKLARETVAPETSLLAEVEDLTARLREYVEDFKPELHPRDTKGRFRKKGGAVLDFAKKLLDGEARAKELAKNADVQVGTEVAGLAVVGDALDYRKTQGLRAQRTGLIEANAREILAKDPVTQSLLTDPNIRQDYTSAYVDDTDVEGNPIRMRVDTHLQRPEGWETAKGPSGAMWFYDPEAVYTEPVYSSSETHPFGTSGSEVNIRVRSQFDPGKTGPIMEREMVGGEAADYLDSTTGMGAGVGGTYYVALSEADFEALERGESVPLDKGDKPGATIQTLGPYPTTKWTQVASSLDYQPIETRPRPDPTKGGGLGSTGYVVAVDADSVRDLPEITAADVRAVVSARPVATNIAVVHPIDLGDRTDLEPMPTPTYTELWAYKPVTDLGDAFPNLATEQSGRGDQAIFATKMLNRERRARAAASANEKAFSDHGAMKDEAMVALADRIDLSDPDVRAFKKVADIILSTEQAPHGDTPEQKLASSIIQSWARSSSNEHTWGHYMQWAASREFGTPLNDWVGGDEFKNQAPGMWATYEYLTVQDYDDEYLDEIRDMMYSGAGFHMGEAFGVDILNGVSESDTLDVERGARKVLRAMYNATQRDLEELGQPEFLLWRGLRRLQETKTLGEIEVGTPEVVSASPNYGGWDISMRREATAAEAAIYAGALQGNTALPIPLDPNDQNKGFYWPNWTAEGAAEAKVAMAGSLPIGEHGMIDRRVGILPHHARDIAGVSDSMFEVSFSPVEYESPQGETALLRVAPMKLKQEEEAARREAGLGAGLDPLLDVADVSVSMPTKKLRIARPEAYFIEKMFQQRGVINIDVAQAADRVENDMLDANRGANKTEKWQIHETRMQALKSLEYAGWDVAPASETTPKIEAALSDPNLVAPWMQVRGMLDPITVKRTTSPGWLQGGVHVSEDVRANPMSSHATSISATGNFSGEGGGRIAGIVAKEDIIGMPGAGYGCLEEDEVVVLGKPRDYLVIPFGLNTPDDKEVVDLIEQGPTAPVSPDVTGTRELPPSLDSSDPFFEQHGDYLDIFVYSSHRPDGSVAHVDLTSLAKWIDQEAGREEFGGESRILLDVGSDGYIRSAVTGELVHVTIPEGAAELTAERLKNMIVEAQDASGDGADAIFQDGFGTKSVVSTVSAPELHAPFPEPVPWESDPDAAWNNVLAQVKENLIVSDEQAAQVAAVLQSVIEKDGAATFKLIAKGPGEEIDVSPGVIQHTHGAVIEYEKTGERYEFSGLTIYSQQDLTSTMLAVKGFFAGDPFTNSDGPTLLPSETFPLLGSTPPPDPNYPDFSSGALAKNWLLSLPKGVGVLTPDDIGKAMRVYLESKGFLADDVHVEAATSLFLAMNGLGKEAVIQNVTYNPEGPSFTVQVLTKPHNEVTLHTFGLPQMVGDNLDADAWWLLLYRLRTVIPNLLPPEADGPEPAPGEIYLAEADVAQKGYIFIDGPENADWPKATWDFWGIDSAAELDAYLAQVHESSEHFMSQPAFYLNLDEKPAWLKLWALQHTSREMSDWKPEAHPRWPTGDKRGGEFRPKVGGIIRSIARGSSGESWSDRLTRAAEEHKAANAEREAYYEKSWREKYAELRARDKAEGKDVSGKSVQNRRSLAMDLALMNDPKYRELRDKTEEARLRLQELKNPPAPSSGPREPVDPELLKDIDDILDDLGIPPAPDEGDVVDVPEVPTVSTAAAEAMKLRAKPKLKLPGVAARSRELEVWKDIAEKRKPYYMTASQSAGAELAAMQDKLRPGEYLSVRGQIRQPLEGPNANTMGYVYSQSLGGWTFADDLRWRPIGGPGAGQGYELWGKTGATLMDRPVDKTGSFGRNESPTKIMELLLGAMMADRDSLTIWSPEDAAKTRTKETKAREREMLDGIRDAAGDWLGYGAVVTDDDVKEYIDGFEPGTTMGRDPMWPISDDMWVKEEDGSGWKVFPRREGEWGWAEEPNRHLTNEETLAVAGESIRQRLIEGKQREQALDFKMEIDAENAARGGGAPEQLPNGGPGPDYVEQQREILRVGKLLDAEVQKRYAEKTKSVPDMKYLQFKKETAEYEVKQAADAAKARNGPLVFDLMADEMMQQTGLSREDAEAAIGYGYWRHHEQGQMSKLIGETFYGRPVTFTQWKAAWNEDLKAKTISYRDEKGFKRGIESSILMNDGEGASDYGVGNIFRLALKANAGDYDLTPEAMAEIPWYAQDVAMNDMLDRFRPKAQEALSFDPLFNAKKRLIDALEKYRAAENTGPMALRDSALEVLSEARQMGGGPKIEYASQVKKDARAVTDEAYDLYPADWQERLAGNSPLGTAGRAVLPLYIALTKQRGKFHSRNATDRKTGGLADQIWGSPGGGGLPDQGGKQRARFDTVVHELGHRFENYMPEIGAAEWTYWNYLARGRSDDMTLTAEVPQSINKIRRSRGKPRGGYRASEVSIRDDMEDEYIVKTYGGGRPYKDWELLTMGYEDLMTGGKQFIGKDDEYRQWILGLLATI